jgi:hypothetical protein
LKYAAQSDETIGLIGSSAVTYCKRVKYLEKAWLLMAKGDNFYWIDQDKIPLDKLKAFKLTEEPKTDTLQRKLEELVREKEALQA